jgi:hypothetical protein
MKVDGIDDGVFTVWETTSLGTKLVCEAYKKEALRAKEVNGFARLDQKDTLKGLKVLVAAKLPDGSYIKKGSKAYIKEELLHAGPWAQKSYTSDAFEGRFFMVDMIYIDFVVPPEPPKDNSYHENYP